MWIFTKDGFFSAVENRDDKSQVMVRARNISDLGRLSTKLKTRWVRSSEWADYEFRLVCSKRRWGKYLAGEGEAIDYDNFKDAMAEKYRESRHNWHRIEQLHDVWAVMRRPPEQRDDRSFEGTVEFFDLLFGDVGRSKE